MIKHDEKNIERIIKKQVAPIQKGIFYDEVSASMRDNCLTNNQE